MFNPKDHIYHGYSRPYCLGQSDGNRRCPVCGEYTNSNLPTTWYDRSQEETKAYMAFFCIKHKPEDLGKWEESL